MDELKSFEKISLFLSATLFIFFILWDFNTFFFTICVIYFVAAMVLRSVHKALQEIKKEGCIRWLK